ncbi:YaiO family outer membrane beta-barrel protein [Cellulophaga baltica]|uniref:YaiO family outer membrane beta-barrel protein n=1 Tax=Cellulophaga TaxID=104264 RepID=UPI001C06E3DA|nr:MULTISPECIES: YaiO family outer membrane beta-barrel protein [Cellulophaga]MBU2996234.1 YaiO family outer membrane beta-barrel protein [Cellulophaga baltica]MDO6767629.1 YaiO family outer membrane beta-barrel protein [Cellulophaga sp. 1_MG-2023]
MYLKQFLHILLFSLFFLAVNAQGVDVYKGNPDASFLAARELAFSGENEIARDTLVLILTEYPDYIDVHNLLAKTYSWEGNYNVARGQFNKILSKERNTKEVWISAIKNEFYAGNYGIALGLSNKALIHFKDDEDLLALKNKATFKINPRDVEDPQTSFLIAEELALSGKREVARDTLALLLKDYPNHVEGKSLLAKTHSWDGDYDVARSEFNEILTKDHNSKEVWISAIENEFSAGNYEIALGLANKALLFAKKDRDLLKLKNKAQYLIDPPKVEDPDGSFETARQLAFSGKREIARDTLEVIISRYPSYVDAHNLKAKTFSWDGDYDIAREEFNKILLREQENKEVWVGAINNELFAENYNTAIGLSNKALLIFKDDKELLKLNHKALLNLDPPEIVNLESKFLIAQNLAFEGKRDVARDTLDLILTKYPDYIDAQNLKAKTYSWDGDYDTARALYNRILSKHHENREVWVSAINNEFYAENYATALGLSNKALLYFKDNYNFLKLKEKAIDAIENPKIEQQLIVENDTLKNGIEVTAAMDIFDVEYDPMYYGSLAYSRTTKYGKIIPKINYSNRFNTNGVQFEVDAYPQFSDKVYAYLNYGYSNSSIYPKHRAGAEVYTGLPKNMEASLGVRFLDFITNKVTIYTGSYGLYTGNYYLLLRGYVTPSENNTFNLSGNLMARKYLKDRYNYLGLNFTYGYSSDLKQFISDNVLLAETILYLESQQLNLEYQFTTKGNSNPYRAFLGVTRQELSFDANNFFYAATLGFSYQFKF